MSAMRKAWYLILGIISMAAAMGDGVPAVMVMEEVGAAAAAEADGDESEDEAAET